MNTTTFEITFDPVYIPIIQGFIRRYIGSSQYEDSLIMTITDGDNARTYANADLIEFLQSFDTSEWQSENLYSVDLKHVYHYQFLFLDSNIDVNIIISKNTQANTVGVNIPKINWNTIGETCKIESTNHKFLNEIQYCIYLGTPNLNDYHLSDQSVMDLIQFVDSSNINNDDVNNPNYPAHPEHPDHSIYEVNKYYTNYHAMKIQEFKLDAKKSDVLNPKVHQISTKIMDMINDDIPSYSANMKIDGIRTLVVIYNNIVLCYQRNVMFIYKHESSIADNYIFDCEICQGRLHIFDCYLCNDVDVSKYNFIASDQPCRFNYINQFVERYPEFIGLQYVMSDVVVKNNTSKNIKEIVSLLSEYYTNSEFNFNDVVTIMKNYYAYAKNNIILDDRSNYYNSLQYFQNPNFSEEVNTFTKNYINALKEIIYRYVNDNYYKNAVEFCQNLGISNDIMFVFSPIIIVGFIDFYNQLGFTSNEKDIKRYSTTFVKTYCKLSESFTEKISRMYKECEYPNDGVIFVKNSPMTFKKGETIYYKWKPLTKLSMDVRLRFNPSNVLFMYDNDNKKYVSADVYYDDRQGSFKYFTNSIDLYLTNFNQTLPQCENGDICTNNCIVELVPLWNGLKMSEFILLKVRYDKIKTNAKLTLNNIVQDQQNYIDIIL